MNRIPFAAVFILFLASCASENRTVFSSTPEAAVHEEAPPPYVITGHKNSALDMDVPEWVKLYLDGGAAKVETLAEYQNRFVFISRHEGNNFNALNLLAGAFSTGQDFPRLAAARIEARFSRGIARPENEYGTFFEALVRAASDAEWIGAAIEDNFWIRRRFAGGTAGTAEESWVFFILVTIDKSMFASGLGEIFRNIAPDPQPSKEQISAAEFVKDNFFEEF